MSIQPLADVGLVTGQFFTALAQLDRALDYESRGWEFESLRWYQSLPRNSEAEYSLDKREVDISKLSVATKQLTTLLKCCIIDFLHRSSA